MRDISSWHDMEDFKETSRPMLPPKITGEEYEEFNRFYCEYQPDGSFKYNFTHKSIWHIDVYGLLWVSEGQPSRGSIEPTWKAPIFNYLARRYNDTSTLTDYHFIYLDGNMRNLHIKNLLRFSEVVADPDKYPNAISWVNTPITSRFVELYNLWSETCYHLEGDKFDQSPRIRRRGLNAMTYRQRVRHIEWYTSQGFPADKYKYAYDQSYGKKITLSCTKQPYHQNLISL